MEMGKGMVSAEEDLEMERSLAKKLKVKNGNLGGLDDELNILFRAIPSALDFMVGNDTDIDDEAEEDCGNIIGSVSTDKKKRKRKKSSVSLPKQLEEEVAVEVSMGDTEVESSEADQFDTSNKKEPCVEETVMDVSVKYVAPRLRGRANVESEELSQVCRRVRGKSSIIS